MKHFKTIFLEEAEKFVSSLDRKVVRKIFYNIRIAERTNDPRVFKKIKRDIWEFRTRYIGLQIRILAFWDKEDTKNTLVLATHGFVKKEDKIPEKEIEKATRIRLKYFSQNEK